MKRGTWVLAALIVVAVSVPVVVALVVLSHVAREVTRMGETLDELLAHQPRGRLRA